MKGDPPPNQPRWLHVTLILLVFTLTGLTITRIGVWLADWIGIVRYSWQYWTFWIVALLPLYQVILLIYAFLLGKFSFFLKKQKRMYAWIGRKLGLTRKKD